MHQRKAGLPNLLEGLFSEFGLWPKERSGSFAISNESGVEQSTSAQMSSVTRLVKRAGIPHEPVALGLLGVLRRL
jgi:hypothetical protein